MIYAEKVVPATPRSAAIILTALLSNQAEKNWLTVYWSISIDENIAQYGNAIPIIAKTM